jgi:hypothetical protein
MRRQKLVKFGQLNLKILLIERMQCEFHYVTKAQHFSFSDVMNHVSVWTSKVVYSSSKMWYLVTIVFSEAPQKYACGMVNG